MGRLEEILKEVCNEKRMMVGNNSPLHILINETAQRYARECVTASLERASYVVKTTVKEMPSESPGRGYIQYSEIDRTSITSQENIILL